MLEFLGNNVAGLEPATLFILKKRPQHKPLLVNFAKFFKRSTFEGNLVQMFLEKHFHLTLLDECFNFVNGETILTETKRLLPWLKRTFWSVFYLKHSTGCFKYSAWCFKDPAGCSFVRPGVWLKNIRQGLLY